MISYPFLLCNSLCPDVATTVGGGCVKLFLTRRTRVPVITPSLRRGDGDETFCQKFSFKLKD